jgi:protein required for attachment to host cells
MVPLSTATAEASQASCSVLRSRGSAWRRAVESSAQSQREEAGLAELVARLAAGEVSAAEFEELDPVETVLTDDATYEVRVASAGRQCVGCN